MIANGPELQITTVTFSTYSMDSQNTHQLSRLYIDFTDRPNNCGKYNCSVLQSDVECIELVKEEWKSLNWMLEVDNQREQLPNCVYKWRF